MSSAFSVTGFRRRAAGTLLVRPATAGGDMHDHDGPSDFALNPESDRHEFTGPIDRPKAAAVLVPIRDVGDDAMVILTRRSTTLRSHSGQIAFPGCSFRSDTKSVAPLETSATSGCGLSAIVVEKTY